MIAEMTGTSSFFKQKSKTLFIKYLSDGNESEERWLCSRLVRFEGWKVGGRGGGETAAELWVLEARSTVISPRTSPDTQSLAVMGGAQKVDEGTDKSWQEYLFSKNMHICTLLSMYELFKNIFTI